MRASLALVVVLASCARVFGLDPVPIDGDAQPPAPSTWTKVALGRVHACGIKPDRTLWCWGRNDRGQLGLGDAGPPEADAPVQVDDAAWIDIVADEAHTCGRRADLSLYCWGENTSLVLGAGIVDEDASATSPMPIAGLWDAIATGDHQACAIEHATQALWCWGSDERAQLLGVGSSTVPVQIMGGSGKWLAIATGAKHVCGIADDQQLYCWGDADFGEVGDGITGTRVTPSAILAPRAASSVWLAIAAGGETTCGIDAGHQLACWGDNRHGELGDQSDVLQMIPTPVAGPEATAMWTSIAVATHHVCGATADGQLRCWGDNRYGQLADPTLVDDERTEPGALGSPGAFSAFAIGPLATCAIGSDNMQCAGHAAGGELGDGSEGSVRTPTKIADGMIAVAAGEETTCAIPASMDAVMCWGNNANGTVGDGSVVDRQTPRKATFPTGLKINAVSVGATACATTATGALYCWGDDSESQLGDNQQTSVAIPQTVLNPSGQIWTGVDAGSNHVCAVDVTKGLWCWGGNSDGQCASAPIGSDPVIGSPHSVPGSWVAIGVGDYTSCAVNAGGVYCWGGNSVGELGNGTTDTPNATPGPIVPSTTAFVVAAGGFFGCALAMPTGAIACWGDGRYGQLGDGLDAVSTTAKTLLAPPIGAQLTAGKEFACATDPTGKLWCWGRDQFAQLGTASPTFADQHVAAAAIDVGASWAAVSAGRDHTCAIDQVGGLWCWGDNVHGEVGNGKAWRAQLVPVR